MLAIKKSTITNYWALQLILLFVSLLLGCSTKSDNFSKQIDTTAVAATEETFNLIAKDSSQLPPPPSVPANEKFTYLILDNQISFIKEGEPLNKALEKLNNFVITRDSTPSCEGCDIYSPLYIVRDKDNQNLFELEVWHLSNEGYESIFRISTTNKRFATKKGIRVGMTIKDLKNKYKIEEVDAGGETGIHLFVKGFSGTFRIESPRNDTNWRLFNKDKEDVLDTLKIEAIIP